MLARVLSAALVGVEAALVRVEVDITSGLPAFTTVGLPDSAVRESRERVRSAIRNAGYAFPSDRITVNLAPADLRKEGASFDLPIALGILAATGSVKPDAIGPFAVVGELALDGQIHAVRGTLAVGLACRRKSIPTIVVPAGNRAEAQAVEGLRVLGASTLRDAVALLNGEATAVLPPAPAAIAAPVSDDLDLADVRGQAHAKRALEIAAAGNHNLLLVGAPGTGQTMYHRPTNAKLCPHFPGILDPRIAPVVARCPRCERPTTRTSILPFLGILGSCLGPVASGEPGEAPLPVWLRAGDPVTAPPLLAGPPIRARAPEPPRLLAGAPAAGGRLPDGVGSGQGARDRETTTLRRREGTVYPRAARIGGIRVYHEADVELLRRREQVPSAAADGK